MVTDTLQVKGKQIEEFAKRSQIKSPLWNHVWYFIGLPLILGLATFITWGDITLQVEAIPMVALVSAVYIVIWVSRYKSSDHFSYQAIGLPVFYTSVGFVMIFTILAMGRLYYSRGFLVSSYLLYVVWIVLGAVFFRRKYEQFIVIRGGLANRLKGLFQPQWNFVTHLNGKLNIQAYDGIVVDLHVHDNEEMLKTLADSSLHGVPVLHAATVLENYTGRTDLTYLKQEGIFDLEQTQKYRMIKSIWEAGLVILLSPLIIPLAGLTALAIKLESRGPVLFTQERVGVRGKLFTLYKFRSMYVDAEENGNQFADEEDDRITRVGRIIRKFRIDELPQFWNVLKGDMSLIGPRPEQKDFVNFFKKEIPFYSYRHKVRPGITGWAQIKDGYAASLSATKKKLEHDLYYIKNISLSFDLLIVYATIKTILTGFGSR